MSSSKTRSFLLPALLIVVFLAAGPGPTSLRAADFGRLSGIVSDTEGNPLMGASVLIVGPTVSGTLAAGAIVQRVITDAQGRFMVERLLPGRYSLQVTSLSRLPALRSSIQVQPGLTARENFALTDILAPLHVQAPSRNVSSWGEDWKWVLRTSASTRPILRYQPAGRTASTSKSAKTPLPDSKRLIGMMPGSTRQGALSGDPGMGSIMAYWRPLSDNADMLVAGSMTASGAQGSSLATAFRRNLSKGDPQELALVVHQLNFADGLPLPTGDARDGLSRAQAMVVSYDHTRKLSDSLSVTSGFEIDYLNAARDVVAAHPRLKLEYRITASSQLTVRYGGGRVASEGTLLDRVGVLSSFPRVTMRGYRPQLEKLNHAEVSLQRKFGKAAWAEVAAYRDLFENAVVWGFGSAEGLGWLYGDFLPNPAANGMTFNAGNYRSSGFRVLYSRRIGNCLETAVVYSVGDALTAGSRGPLDGHTSAALRRALRPERSQSLAGKVSTRIPLTNTQFTTSYQWLQRGRVTSVDPFGQASLQVQPFLNLQIRQPLPNIAFLPARIEALADFRNLLAQGYVPLSAFGDETLLLTPAYRSFRGGFSVQF